MSTNTDRRWRRVGIVVPSTNSMVETDFWRHAPDNVTVHAARMFLEETTAEDERRMISEFLPSAVRDLSTVRPDVVVFACTSAGAVLGTHGEQELIAQIHDAVGAPVVSTNDAVARALMRRGVKRPAVVTPYIPELTEKIVSGLAHHGIEGRDAVGMGIVDPFDIVLVGPRDIIAFVREHVDLDRVDGIFVSCTNFQGFDAIEALKTWSGLPVVSSNQAALEQAVLELEAVAA